MTEKRGGFPICQTVNILQTLPLCRLRKQMGFCKKELAIFPLSSHEPRIYLSPYLVFCNFWQEKRKIILNGKPKEIFNFYFEPASSL